MRVVDDVSRRTAASYHPFVALRDQRAQDERTEPPPGNTPGLVLFLNRKPRPPLTTVIGSLGWITYSIAIASQPHDWALPMRPFHLFPSRP